MGPRRATASGERRRHTATRAGSLVAGFAHRCRPRRNHRIAADSQAGRLAIAADGVAAFACAASCGCVARDSLQQDLLAFARGERRHGSVSTRLRQAMTARASLGASGDENLANGANIKPLSAASRRRHAVSAYRAGPRRPAERGEKAKGGSPGSTST